MIHTEFNLFMNTNVTSHTLSCTLKYIKSKNLHLFNESRFDNIKGLELEYENLALQIFVSLPCVINTSVGYCVLGKCCYVVSNNFVI